jgi:hypothetical protein
VNRGESLKRKNLFQSVVSIAYFIQKAKPAQSW